MTRQQFLGALLSPVLLLFRRKEEKPPEYALKYAKAFYENSIRKYPLSYDECYRPVQLINGRRGQIIMVERTFYDENRQAVDKLLRLHYPNREWFFSEGHSRKGLWIEKR